jgi:hypothetical protein
MKCPMKSNKKTSPSFTCLRSEITLPQLRGMFISPDLPQIQETGPTDPEVLLNILLQDLLTRKQESINVE